MTLTHEHTDQALAQAVQAGDLEAYGELVRRYQGAVFGVCYRLLGERQDAEDLAQEAFLRAYQRFHLYDSQRPFGPWVRRLAANLCLNHLESRQSPAAELLDEADPDPESRDPETVLLHGERRLAVQTALLRLPPRQRTIVELRHYQDLSYTEIAETLHLPLSDVKSHLFRARTRLAGYLSAYE